MPLQNSEITGGKSTNNVPFKPNTSTFKYRYIDTISDVYLNPFIWQLLKNVNFDIKATLKFAFVSSFLLYSNNQYLTNDWSDQLMLMRQAIWNEVKIQLRVLQNYFSNELLSFSKWEQLFMESDEESENLNHISNYQSVSREPTHYLELEQIAKTQLTNKLLSILTSNKKGISFDPEDIRLLLIEILWSIDQELGEDNIFKWDLEIISRNFLNEKVWGNLSKFFLDFVIEVIQDYNLKLELHDKQTLIKDWINVEYQLSTEKFHKIIDYIVIPFIWTLIDLVQLDNNKTDEYMAEAETFNIVKMFLTDNEIKFSILKVFPDLIKNIKKKELFLKHSTELLHKIVDILFNYEIPNANKKRLISNEVISYLSTLTSRKRILWSSAIKNLALNLTKYSYVRKNKNLLSFLNLSLSENIPYFVRTKLIHHSINLLYILNSENSDSEIEDACNLYIRFVLKDLRRFDPDLTKRLIFSLIWWSSQNEQTSQVKFNSQLIKKTWLAVIDSIWYSIDWLISMIPWNDPSNDNDSLIENIVIGYVSRNQLKLFSDIQTWVDFKTSSVSKIIQQTIDNNIDLLPKRTSIAQTIKSNKNDFKLLKQIYIRFSKNVLLPVLRNWWKIDIDLISRETGALLLDSEFIFDRISSVWIELNWQQKITVLKLVNQIQNHPEYNSSLRFIITTILNELSTYKNLLEAVENIWKPINKVLDNPKYNQLIVNSMIDIAVDIFYDNSFEIEQLLVDYLTEKKYISEVQSSWLRHCMIRISSILVNTINKNELKRFLFAIQKTLNDSRKDKYTILKLVSIFINNYEIDLVQILKEFAQTDIIKSFCNRLFPDNSLLNWLNYDSIQLILNNLSRLGQGDILDFVNNVILIIERFQNNWYLDVNLLLSSVIELLENLANEEILENLELFNQSWIKVNKQSKDSDNLELWNIDNSKLLINIIKAINLLNQCESCSHQEVIDELHTTIVNLWKSEFFEWEIFWLSWIEIIIDLIKSTSEDDLIEVVRSNSANIDLLFTKDDKDNVNLKHQKFKARLGIWIELLKKIKVKVLVSHIKARKLELRIWKESIYDKLLEDMEIFQELVNINWLFEHMINSWFDIKYLIDIWYKPKESEVLNYSRKLFDLIYTYSKMKEWKIEFSKYVVDSGWPRHLFSQILISEFEKINSWFIIWVKINWVMGYLFKIISLWLINLNDNISVKDTALNEYFSDDKYKEDFASTLSTTIFRYLERVK